MNRMYTSQFFILFSALVAIAQAAPSHPPDESAIVDFPTVVSYAGAPANGEYPDEVAAKGGWGSDAPTYDTAVSLHPRFESKADLMVGGNCCMVCYYRTLAPHLMDEADNQSADGPYATPVHGSGFMPATDVDSCYQVSYSYCCGKGPS
jgi:hypothetical protein